MDSVGMYTKDTKIWVPDEKDVWVGGRLIEDLNDNTLEIELDDGREVVIDLKASNFQLPPLRNPDILIGANDLTTLSYLHEPAVLYNLKERFLNTQAIYTYCGIVLVALNPYKDVPLYGPDIISTYSGQDIRDLDPHIFAVAEDAYKNMIDLGKNQSIIVSGESGAGKTVSAKYAMRYFANVGGSATETAIEMKVMSSNPIMEAIGNAKTIRNDNSSRFGKYLEINFDEVYSIIGAHMRTYLLEKSRVVYQASNERNYHIFYQLCQSRELPELKELHLKNPDEFFYTQQGEDPIVKDVDDQKTFEDTMEAMSMLGIYNEQQRMIWRILAAILHLGNVEILLARKKTDQCFIKKDDFHVQMVSSLLGVDHDQLCKWLCARKIIATGEVYVKPLTSEEAHNGRDALAKHIYSQLFQWIVEHVNSSLAMTTQRKSFIGVLDIYGFETFEVNSFEQFCINYANEKLQQQFNLHVFKLEQDEYIKEQIIWSFIDFYDNQPCIDLIEKSLGILDLLDEECRMPKGADDSWAQKLYTQHLKSSDHFVKPRMSNIAFIIRHYADDVIYDCNGFVEKNRDLINEEHLAILRASEYEVVAELFSGGGTPSVIPPRKRTSSRVGGSAPKGRKTVGSQFRESLMKLMETLDSTSPHYVRCIKSNDNKAAFQLDLHRCIQQLRACGVLETIRISAAGYPSRWTYQEFFNRYRMLVSWDAIDWDSLNKTCDIILKEFIEDEDKFQLGNTKIFFRAGAVAYLERIRSDILKTSCIKIQKNVKRWIVYRQFHRLRSATILIQCWIRGYQARKLVQFMRETRASIKIQKIWRGYKARCEYIKVYEFLVFVQSRIRGVLIRRRLREYVRNNRAVIIQKYFRKYQARKQYLKIRTGIILIQCCVRRMAAKKELKRLKIEARSVEHYKTLTKGMENKVITLQQKLTEQTKERKVLQEKVSNIGVLEEEIQSLKNVKSDVERLEGTNVVLEKENIELKTSSEESMKTIQKMGEDMEMVKSEKDQEIASLKSSVEILRLSLAEQKKKFEEEAEIAQETLRQRLEEQREQMLAEFNMERASHQKMLGEYARLEQRFSNMQEELQIVKNSPDKRSFMNPVNFEMVNGETHGETNGVEDISRDEEDSVFEDSHNVNKIEQLSFELSEARKERDMLLEEVELLKEERNTNKKIERVHSITDDNYLKEQYSNENKLLTDENEKMKDEINTLTIALDENLKRDPDNQDRQFTQLMNQIKELKEENAQLRSRLNERDTLENKELKEDLEHTKKKLKEAMSRTITSPPRGSSRIPISEMGLSARTRSDVSEHRRPRATTDNKKLNRNLTEDNLSEAGKLLMTYAGLMRKSTTAPTLPTIPSTATVQRRGLLKFGATEQEELVSKLVTSINRSDVEREIPGLPAHIIFMGVRYVDHVNDERLMQSYLATVITNVKKIVSRNPGDIDQQAFWLNNAHRLFCDMKQFGGEEQFQSVNTREQNQQSLLNFDLSEYRQVLSDMCVKIYQDMSLNIQTRISNLIVPGMLEYESIPGVVSTLRNFKSKRRTSVEIITVKDITNKLSAILAVLNAHCVDPNLIKQIFRQIYYFINATMVNNVLLRKDMCHWSRGLQMKFNLTQLEEWCRINQLHENYGVVEELEAITEIVQLLQVNKKSTADVDGIIEISSKLNALQVQKLLSMYTTPNEYEPRVPGNLIRAVVNKMKKDENASLMLDLKYVVPMTVPFIPSTVNFEKLKIPPSLMLDKFEIM